MEIKDELLDIEDIKRSKKPLLDLFIRRTAVITQTSESLTDLVIRDQWRNTLKTLGDTTPVNEVDIPMIGLLRMSETKVKKKLHRNKHMVLKYQENLSTEEKQKQRQLSHIQGYEKQTNSILNKLKIKQDEI